MIPNTARKTLLSGIPGTISHFGPLRALSAMIDPTADPALCRFGRVYTFTDDSKDMVTPGGEGVIAGVMIHPHAYAIDADQVAPGSVCEFVSMGELYVGMTGDPKRGDGLMYDPETGILAPTGLVDGISVPGSVVSRHAPSVERNTESQVLATVTLTGPLPAAAEAGDDETP